jgi:hypothetical protein
MKILFEEWSCPNISDKQKEEIQAKIEKELLSFEDDIKPLPKKLTVSIFEVPHTRQLSCSGVDENGDELVTFIYPISREDTKYKWKQDLLAPKG